MKRSLPWLSLLIVLLVSFPVLQAQGPGGGAGSPLYVGSQRAPIQVSSLMLYQRFEDDDLSQLTLPLAVFVPVSSNLALSLRTGYASADGSGMTELSGLADAQVALSYHQAIGLGGLVASVSANLPSGESSLTQEQAATAFLVGQSFYGFRLPSLGQGFNVSPGLTWAAPLGEAHAVGVGVAYQYRGAFEPRSGINDRYDPGDELLLTVGLDHRLNPASAFALDLTYVHYQADEWRGVTYETGDAIALTGQWASTTGPLDVQILGRVRRKAGSTLPPEASTLLGLDATVPIQGRVRGHLRYQVGSRFRIGAWLQGRHYVASEAFRQRTLYDVGLLPELDVFPGLTLLGRLGGTVGTLQGLEAGFGFSWSM
ncbi:MAG: hypothetical protein HKN04_05805 [Rhodothermaceae bacterium]|nr:hypothetical protein [Rhodothermaceae bacterium]